jgi:hypothetical protein
MRRDTFWAGWALALAVLAHGVMGVVAPVRAGDGAVAKREYKVAYLTFSGYGNLDKMKDAQAKALNDFATEGWRLVTVTQVGNGGQVMLYLER